MESGAYGRALVQARKARRVSQTALIAAVGIDRSHLSKIENGRIEVPSDDVRERLATALGMTDDQLLAEAGMQNVAGRVVALRGGGALREEPGEHDDSIDPDEYRVRAILRALPAEDRAMLVDIADVFDRRHRERFD